jgi:hypothetical protein
MTHEEEEKKTSRDILVFCEYECMHVMRCGNQNYISGHGISGRESVFRSHTHHRTASHGGI